MEAGDSSESLVIRFKTIRRHGTTKLSPTHLTQWSLVLLVKLAVAQPLNKPQHFIESVTVHKSQLNPVHTISFLLL
jgi:hypothetical protein